METKTSMVDKNYGLIEDNRHIKDWMMGGSSPVEFSFLTDDWTPYLPEKEYQYNPGKFDTMACVSFSALNVLETLFNYYLQKHKVPLEDYEWLRDKGYMKNGKINFSDRYIAKLSGTTKRGNTYRNVADAIRKYGLIPEDMWTMHSSYHWSDYYTDVPQHLIDIGSEFKERFGVFYEFVMFYDVVEAMTTSPIQTGVYAWTAKNKFGIYTQRSKTTNHAVMRFKKSTLGYPTIFDHYDNIVKKFVANYRFGSNVRFKIEFKNKDNSMPNIEENTLVQEVTDSGKFGVYFDGRIYVDKLAEVHATWSMRTKGNGSGLTKALTKEEWDKYPKYNLKNEKL